MKLKMTVDTFQKMKMKMRNHQQKSRPSLLMLKVITTVLFATLLFSPAHGIHINSNGGYEDIVVTIGKDVPPITCQQLLQNIQGIFTSASEYLREATDGRVYFHRVMIVIPPMWDTRACGRSVSINSYTSRSRTNDAAIRITTEHSIFGHMPWTQQSRGCGLPGDFISMGYHYILQFNGTDHTMGSGSGGDRDTPSDRNTGTYGNSIEGQWSAMGGRNFARGSSDNTPKDRAFVHEWAKFRYGVFEEIGFPNDPIYPAVYSDSGSSERKPTSCTNHPLRGNWSGGCSGWAFERNSTCKFTPLSTGNENDRVTSSIMSFPQGRNVRKFCDSQTHNKRAPTKHNFMCDRKSTSEIIYNHEDFKTAPLLRDQNMGVPQTEFIVKQIAQPRFVLLVEETGNMNLRDVWKFLKLAVRKFIKYDLSGGTEIGLITINSNDVRVLANMTSLQSLTIRRALADKLANYPNVDGGGNIAIRRGIFQAVEVLKRNQQRAAGSVIILISQGTVSAMDLETSLELLREEEVSLASIEYPSLSDGKIAALAEGTNGPHFTIRETGVGSMTHLSTYMNLINALMAIQKFYTEDVVSTWPVTIHQIEYRGDSRSYIEANFSFESTAVQSPGEFFIYTANPNDPKINNVELISPNGIRYTTQLSDLHDINVIKIDALINEPGVWRYRIERLADSHQSHFVQVVTRTTAEDLNVRLYSNVPENKIANLSSTPIILYTEVKRKNSPVIDADVEALVVAGAKRWAVTLLDNGNGDADLTKNDGVYSRYFILPPSVSASHLEISSRVIVNPYRAKFSVVNQDPLYTHNPIPCCGSLLSPADPKQQYKIVPFGERNTNVLNLRVNENPSLGYYPPGRIGDLRLVSIDSYNRAATITWTAPGEDYDQGIVASYQIFYSADINNEDWKLLTDFTADIEAGIQDNTTIRLPQYGSFMLAISAVNFYGKAGKISNILRVSIFQPGKEQPRGHVGANSYGMSRTTPSTEELKDFDYSMYYYLYIIICSIVVMLLLSALLVLLLYCRKMGLSQRKPAKNGNDGKIAAITDPKSPIHWSASELLGEHEKRHSLYDGSASPEEGSTNSAKIVQQHPHHYVNHALQNGSLQHHPMHLNIVSQDFTMGGNSPSRTTHSPADSYDDPESPTPIPISVRSRHMSPTELESRHQMFNNMSSSNYLQSASFHPQYHHYQIPQNNSGFPHPKIQNPSLGLPLTHSHHGGHSSMSGSSTHSSNLSSNNIQQIPHNLKKHYDPEIQGSTNSVSSKKRNITMV